MLAQQLFNGILLGSVYGLFALGLTLVLGALNLLNFAHGEALMFSAFAVLVLATGWQAPFPVILIGAVLVAVVISVVTYLLSFRWVDKSYWTAAALSTIGVSILFQTLATRIWGTDQQQVPNTIIPVSFDLGVITVTNVQLTILITTAGLMLGLHLLLTRTRTGRAIRALSEDRTVAMLLGINVERTIQITFIVAGVLAGVAGALVTSVFNTITPFIGLGLTIKGITAITVGGMGNPYGAILAGLLIGILETLTVTYGSASYRDGFVFILLIVILLARPEGLLGTQTPERV